MATADLDSLIQGASQADFTVTTSVDPARAGTLRVAGAEIETPNLFPVLNFYAGGTDASMFGGGVHRTMKEFLAGHERIGGGDFTEFFDAVMTSVSSLTDYNITEERFESYMSTPIKERSEFERFNGPLFVDSGGYKFLHNDGFDGADFHIEINQETALDMQRRMGADVIINLDQPIAPDDSYQERIAKARETAQNIAEFLRLSQDYEAARYLSVHGYNYAMIDSFLDEVFDIIGPEIARRAFDGVALGGLVPKKDNKQALVTAVSDCRQVLEDRGFRDMPFHVLGISNSSIPLLTALGVDTFDSMAYLHAAINGKYHKSLLEDVSYDEANFEECGCPVCSDSDLVDRMQGNAEYQKDILGPVAMHNLIIQKREVADIRNRIVEDGRDGLIEYFDETVARNDRTRKVAHRVVNEYLGGYF